MIEAFILAAVVGATVFTLWLAKKHGIVLRPDAGGLEAVPREIHEAELRKEVEALKGQVHSRNGKTEKGLERNSDHIGKF